MPPGDSPVAVGSLQAEVRRTMLAAGGYWRPLAAVARLLEELGELLELLVQRRRGAGDLASELADLWIITTALADQFRIEVPDPQGSAAAPGGTPTASGLVITAGQIARVVNYYDGPKLPRRPGELPSLAESIADFHEQLGELCAALGVDLSAAVKDKFTVIHGRDMTRFAREDSDPSTSPTLALLPAPWREARLWGAPAARPGLEPRELAAALAPSLLAFTRAAPAEGLEGYVIGARARPGSRELDRWLTELKAGLTAADPAGGDARKSEALQFNGLELSLAVLPVQGSEDGDQGAKALVLLRPADGSVLVRPGDDPRGPRHD